MDKCKDIKGNIFETDHNSLQFPICNVKNHYLLPLVAIYMSLFWGYTNHKNYIKSSLILNLNWEPATPNSEKLHGTSFKLHGYPPSIIQIDFILVTRWPLEYIGYRQVIYMEISILSTYTQGELGENYKLIPFPSLVVALIKGKIQTPKIFLSHYSVKRISFTEFIYILK